MSRVTSVAGSKVATRELALRNLKLALREMVEIQREPLARVFEKAAVLAEVDPEAAGVWLRGVALELRDTSRGPLL